METSGKSRAAKAVALFSAFAIAAPESATAVSARFEGTEIAELLAAQEVAGKKKAVKPVAVKTAPVVKASPVKAQPTSKPIAGKDAPVDLPAVKYAVPEPTKRVAPAPAKQAVKPAPLVVKSVAKPAVVVKQAPKIVPVTASKPTKAPVPKADPNLPKPTPGKLQKTNLAELKAIAPEAVKGGKGMQLKNEAPKTRLAAITAGGAGLGAVFGLGKSAAGVNAAKGAAAKSAAVATQADAAEALAVLVAGTAVGQTGTSIVNKNSRVRQIRRTPKGELPLPIQTLFAVSVPASFVFAIFQFLLAI